MTDLQCIQSQTHDVFTATTNGVDLYNFPHINTETDRHTNTPQMKDTKRNVCRLAGTRHAP